MPAAQRAGDAEDRLLRVSENGSRQRGGGGRAWPQIVGGSTAHGRRAGPAQPRRYRTAVPLRHGTSCGYRYWRSAPSWVCTTRRTAGRPCGFSPTPARTQPHRRYRAHQREQGRQRRGGLGCGAPGPTGTRRAGAGGRHPSSIQPRWPLHVDDRAARVAPGLPDLHKAGPSLLVALEATGNEPAAPASRE